MIKDGPQVEVLNGISLHGGLAVSWPREASLTAKVVVECLIEHWKAVGLPGYAQFDNDTLFQGTHAHPDVVGRVTRLWCPSSSRRGSRGSRRSWRATTGRGRRRSGRGSCMRACRGWRNDRVGSWRRIVAIERIGSRRPHDGESFPNGGR